MQKYCRLFIFLFSFTLLLFFLSFSTSAASEQVCDSYNELYQLMVDDVLMYKTESVYYTKFKPSKISLEKIKENIKEKDYIQSNCLYSIKYTYERNFTHNVYEISVSFSLYMTESQRASVKKLCNEIAEDLADRSDFEKIKYAHDYVILNCEYSILHNGPYNCLKKGKACCNGYALAFQMIMDACDIRCQYITNSDHAWNEVWIDGKSYNIDLTWDDGEGRAVSYDYFLKCDADFPNHPGASATAFASYSAGKLTADNVHCSIFSFIFQYWYVVIIIVLVFIFFIAEIIMIKKNKEREEAVLEEN